MTSAYKGVIFDLDGTLYDAAWFPLRIVLRIFPALRKITASRSARKKMMGDDYNNGSALRAAYFAEIAVRTGDDPARLEAWYEERFYPAFIAVLTEFYTARKGLVNALIGLRERGIRLGVLSDYARVHERLRAIEFDPFIFHARLSSEEFGAFKPASRPFLEVARQMGTKPEETLVVGDRRDTDIAGANASGMPSIFLTKKNVEGGMTYETLLSFFAQRM